MVAQTANLSFKNKFLYISVTDEASYFKFGLQLGFAKVHHQIPLEEKWVWPWARGAPQILGFPYNISETAGASDFKFGAQLEFAKAHHKITHRRKSGHGLGLMKLPIILWFHFNIYTMAETRNFKFDTKLGFVTKPHPEKKWAWPWVIEAPVYLGFSFNISATAALSS